MLPYVVGAAQRQRVPKIPAELRFQSQLINRGHHCSFAKTNIPGHVSLGAFLCQLSSLDQWLLHEPPVDFSTNQQLVLAFERFGAKYVADGRKIVSPIRLEHSATPNCEIIFEHHCVGRIRAVFPIVYTLRLIDAGEFLSVDWNFLNEQSRAVVSTAQPPAPSSLTYSPLWVVHRIAGS
jgi:hypothetical protein